MSGEILAKNNDVIQALAGEQRDALQHMLVEILQAAMNSEVSAQIGAGLGEHSADRTTHRNGYRDRPFDTRLGSLPLRIPKVRDGSFFPSFLEPRRRAEQALMAVVQEAYVHGVSTRNVDNLVQAMGVTHMDKSQVSRWCAQLDEQAALFRDRPLDEPVPYVWLDALYEKVRLDGRVQSMAVVVAIGVTATGRRTVLGVAVGQTESGAFWTEFLRSLVRRGLTGVRLVISDAHEGLKEAIPKVLQEASWQRCRVHTMRNCITQVPRASQGLVTAACKTVFAQPSQADALARCDEVVTELADRWPGAAARLAAARDDVLAYLAFPPEHWRQLHSTNPLERLNKEIRRRTRVVGIFPNPTSLLRLVTMLLAEQDDEWQAASKAYMSQSSMAKVTGEAPPPALMKEVATG